jgi:hypothetical protein
MLSVHVRSIANFQRRLDAVRAKEYNSAQHIMCPASMEVVDMNQTCYLDGTEKNLRQSFVNYVAV